MIRYRLLGAVAAAMLVALPGAACADGLPKGFAYLANIDPSIAQDMRYFGAHNFVGRRVTGYEAAECVLTEAAARALAAVQAVLAPSGLGLKVYDCYRPARAVADFVAWSKEAGSEQGRAYFYSTIPKNRLFPLGYIATRSNHSAGSTVDLGLIRLPQAGDGAGALPADTAPEATAVVVASKAVTCYARAPRGDEVDMGTDFDCFHPKSGFGADGVSADAESNRALLRRVMVEAGFAPYDTEWWHFTLKDEPFPKRAFDFPVMAREAR